MLERILRFGFEQARKRRGKLASVTKSNAQKYSMVFWDEMTDRLENYTSFAGAPEDAESSVKFVYKTAETVAAADNVVAETETVKEGNIFTRLWQRIVNLFKF